MTNLETLIRSAVKLGRPSSGGFETCVCQVCNDYKERGGFNLRGDGIGYNCFNCGTTFGIKYGRATKEAIDHLVAFGIDREDIKQALAREQLEAMGNSSAVAAHDKVFKKQAVVKQPTIELPPLSISIHEDDMWAEVAREYISSRGLDPTEIHAYVSHDARYEGRLILPVFDYTGGRLVYWQARSMDDSEPRFKNPSVGKDTAIYNEQALHQHDNSTIYVTEGIFDAWSCGSTGIAPLGSRLTDDTLLKLRRANLRGRTLVFVIDKNNNGYKLGTLALREGWKILVMPDNIDDANQCLRKLGKLFLINWLASQQQDGMAAKLTLELKCKDK